MFNVRYDPTISLGTIIAIGALLVSTTALVVTVLTAYTNFTNRLQAIDTKVTAVWDWWQRLMPDAGAPYARPTTSVRRSPR